MAQHSRAQHDNTACYTERMQVSMVGQLFVKNVTTMIIGGISTNENNPLIMGYIVNHNSAHSGFQEMISAFLPHFLALLVLMVVVSRFLHFSLRWLKQPLIVCQILTGILLFSFLPSPKGAFPTSNEKSYINPANRRVEQTMGAVGVLFNLFIGSVKLDVSSIYEFGRKKPLIIGIASQFITLGVGSLLCGLMRNQIYSLFGLSVHFLMFALQPLASTYPVVLVDIFTELGLLNTELGRLALSSSMMQCFAGWILVISLNVFMQGQKSAANGFITLVCILGLITVIVFVIRPYTLWIVRNTRSNARVRSTHILTITLLVLGLSLFDDIVGFAYPDGAVIMGLTMPHGPPLGTALIERVDLVTSELFLPVTFMHTGVLIDWAGLVKEWRLVLGVEFFVLVTFFTKLFGCACAAKYCKMSFKDGLLIGLMMNLRGLIDILVFLSMASFQIINRAMFTALVLSTVGITAICAWLISFLYKPLRTKGKRGSQTVQNVRYSSEFRMMTCFYDDKPVSALIDFLESSTSSVANKSLCIYTLHLIELHGSAASSLIEHRNNQGDINPAQMDRVHNHFITLAENKKGVRVCPYTSHSPLKTMHQDACSLILEKNIHLVIVPYPRKNSVAALEDDIAMRSLVPLVLHQAPCSVGIMVHRGTTRIRVPESWKYHVGVLFWGGPDDREAIAIASHVARHPGVYLNILCFVASDKIDSQQKNDTYNESQEEKCVDSESQQKKDVDSESKKKKDVDNESRQEKDVDTEKLADNGSHQEKYFDTKKLADNESRQEKDVDGSHQEKYVNEKLADYESRQEKYVDTEKLADNESRQENDVDTEKLADDKAISELQITNLGNERVVVSEIAMENVAQTCSVIHDLGVKNDLLIVGQRQKGLLLLGEDLEQWTESPELGVIGDILATSNMCIANVLVVQQHKLSSKY